MCVLLPCQAYYHEPARRKEYHYELCPTRADKIGSTRFSVLERLWASKRQPIDFKRCCTDRLNAHPERRHLLALRLLTRRAMSGLVRRNISICKKTAVRRSISDSYAGQSAAQNLSARASSFGSWNAHSEWIPSAGVLTAGLDRLGADYERGTSRLPQRRRLHPHGTAAVSVVRRVPGHR